MNEHNPENDVFYCMTCNRPFRSPLYSITRSVEVMIFYAGERLPEAEVLFAESIGDYCSQKCLDKDRGRLLTNEKVRATFPGPGPVETCSHCGGPVDMVKPHPTWTEEVADVTWGQGIDQIHTTKAHLLAVKCQRCRSGTSNAYRSERETTAITGNEG